MDLLNILKYVVAGAAAGLIFVVLLQAPRSGGLGIAFGGSGGGGEAYRSKRGVEAVLYNLTIVLVIVLIVGSLGLAILSA
jgi:protein translocase SecG subunit